ncbi:MAG TPA: polyribonucleotide nucleotidyltransferase [Dehalococcoidia bacterium]|nr:polyribonucleotide nucleotidyltransferase [Dehalococcoidia bacterium]
MVHSYTCEIAGRVLTIETGKLAEQANGAVTVRYGDTVVLVTTCASKETREGVDFLPLTVDYEERLYAAGKIPGGFIRREGRPTDEATLVSRMTDRPLRPLFPKGWHNETQVVITVLSADQENDPDTLAVIGASAALFISDIPFTDPVSAVHVGYVDGKLKLNPTLAEAAAGGLDLVVASTGQTVVMVEAGAKEITDSLLLEAIRMGHEANLPVVGLQQKIRAEIGKAKIQAPPVVKDEDLEKAVKAATDGRLDQVIFQKDKKSREEHLNAFTAELVEKLKDRFQEPEITAALDGMVKKAVRTSVLDKGRRLDGRSFAEIRPLSCEVGLLPRTHGSGMFRRGLTQAMTITTLGSISERQKLDGLGIEETKRFMHHYNFPPFSTGEVKRMAGRSRREIGHGALVERALLPVIPDESEFPYTIRLVSEVLSSSGSTSMASACASTLSLMDAGVPIKAPVAGIAMGLMTDDSGKVAVLTDIEGLEDAYGDMDCKIAGTSRGITALQMDTKLKGIDFGILQQAFKQAEEARLFILDVMLKTIGGSREQLSLYAPRMYKITIDPSKIGSVIGPGGKNIRAIIEETKATIDISDDGTVLIGSSDEEAAQKAIRIIEGMTKEIEVGGVYTGKVSRILNFGAMVEILPGKEGLVHISELADYRVPTVEDVVKLGDEIMVKVIEIDRLGRVNLSRKAVFGDISKIPGASISDSATPETGRPPMPPRPANRPFQGGRGRRA